MKSPASFVVRLLGLAVASLLGTPAFAQSSWTTGRFNLPGVNAAYGVAYGNGRFVATLGGTGANGVNTPATASSADGVTWTASSLTSPQQGSIVFTAGAFYLAGGNTVQRSADGTNWTTLYTATNGNTFFRGIATDGRSMLIGSASSSNPTYLYSRDLLTWEFTLPLPNAGATGTTTNLGAPVYAFDRYYVTYSVVASGLRLTTSAATTADGFSWTANSTLASALSGYVVAGNGRLYALATGLTTYLSTDGVNFAAGALPAELVNNGPLLFAGGRFFMTGSLVSSLDTVSWRALASIPPNINPPTRAMAYGRGRYVAVGYSFDPTITDFVAYLAASAPPLITASPAARTVVEGNPAAFAVALDNPDTATTFQWRRDGVAIPGATAATLTLARTAVADAGRYACTVTNALGATASDPALLTVILIAQAGRIINLSVLTSLDAPDTDFTVGFVLGGAGTTGPKSLLIRAAGPSLAPFGIANFLPDPKLPFFADGALAGENNDWLGTAPLTALIAQTGAFAYTGPASKDAAFSAANLTTAAHTVIVSSATVGAGTGSVIAEVYDATPAAAITAATPRLINVSVLKNIPANGTLTAGFVIGGLTPKTVLIRVTGPALTPLGVTNVLADPRLTFYQTGTAVALATNDNWSGTQSLKDAMAAVGAFPIDPAGKDSALLLTLSPGSYTAQATGVGSSAGTALVEIYEVP